MYKIRGEGGESWGLIAVGLVDDGVDTVDAVEP